MMSRVLLTPAILFLTGMLCPLSVAAQDEGAGSDLPTVSTMMANLPSPKELLDQVEPIDWIELKIKNNGENTILKAELVPGRPTTLRDYKKKNIRKLTVILPDSASEYEIPTSQIERIIYAEEQMLRVVDNLLPGGDAEAIETAFELITVVERRIPGWAPTGKRLQSLLYADGLRKRQKNEPELALALLEECQLLAGTYKQLQPLPAVAEMVGEITNELVGKAVQQSNFRKAQHFIRRVGTAFPDHPVRQQWLKRLEAMAQKHYNAAEDQYSKKDYAVAAAEVQRGHRIWAAQRDNAATYRKVLTRYQQLNVGVTSLGQKFPVSTPAKRRHEQLRDVTLFEPYRADSVVYYDTSFFEQWDPLDLGRRVVFSLRKQQPSWAGVPKITSPNIIDTLKVRMDKNSPGYDERFASYIDEFLVKSPYEFEVRFSRIPLRVEALFSFPITNPDGTVLTRRFAPEKVDDNTTSFKRTIPEPDGAQSYHVAEVIEHKFERSAQAIQALERGELQMIAHLQPWEIDTYESNKKYYRRRYAQPFVHVIQFNPETEILKNPQVRRALSKSINRERILKRVVLQDEAMRHGRVVAAPWPSESYANSSLVEPPVYNLATLREAAALRGTAEMVLKNKEEEDKTEEQKQAEADQKTTQELPELRLILEEDPVVSAAAQEILKFWRTCQFKVKVVESTDDPAGWDLAYYKLKMTEPLTDLWPFLTLADEATVDGLLVLPDWLKQKLVDLDFNSNFPAAESDLRLLHRHLSSQAFFIPLWEVDDYAVFTATLNGFADEPVTPYQQIAGWSVKPNPAPTN